MADYDLAVIGGGLTGTSIARDAAGRGLRVVLFEQADLGSGASSASARLMAGDLKRLERRSFISVRRALEERDRQLQLAPHLVRQIRFVIPLHPEGRPSWLLRLGLSIYDRLAHDRLPASDSLDLSHHEAGFSLQRPFGSAVEFSDAVADDIRLTVLNAVDAAERGAEIRTRARCVRADRNGEWRIVVVDRGSRRIVTATALVSAVGAWTGQFAETVLRMPPPASCLLRETQILVRRLFDHDRVYVLQHRDGRLVFVQTYGHDLTAIGMATGPFQGDLAAIAPPAADIVDLCMAANRFFREQLSPGDVVATVCAVRARPTVRGREDLTRSGVLSVDRKFHEAPLVTAFGGDMTSYRLQAEQAMDALATFYPKSVAWTATVPLAGGDFTSLDELIYETRRRFPFLKPQQAMRLARAYGTRTPLVLGDAKSVDDLGPRFGDDLTGAEVRYLMTREWARMPEDVLARRTKFGLSISPAERDALAQFMQSVA